MLLQEFCLKNQSYINRKNQFGKQDLKQVITYTISIVALPKNRTGICKTYWEAGAIHYSIVGI